MCTLVVGILIEIFFSSKSLRSLFFSFNPLGNVYFCFLSSFSYFSMLGIVLTSFSCNREQLNDFKASGVISTLSVAVSRDETSECKYVQDSMMRQAGEIAR